MGTHGEVCLLIVCLRNICSGAISRRLLFRFKLLSLRS